MAPTQSAATVNPAVISERIGAFFHEGSRLEYTEYGEGDRHVVLVHGQLMPRRMHQPLARALAEAGHHVITLDLLGHGSSDRPEDSMAYSMTAFGEQVLHLLDELSIDRAVLGGTSLGANVALEVAVLAPDRVAGIIAEMPVLENALHAGIVAFVPLMFAARYLPITINTLRWASRPIPRGFVPFWAGIVLDTLDQQPGAMAATLHGVIFGRVAPPSRVRERIEAPALVIGHPHDPIHPAADAAMLADELVNAQFVEAKSLLEWRFTPDRLDQATIDFVQDCYAPEGEARARTAAAAKTGSRRRVQSAG